MFKKLIIGFVLITCSLFFNVHATSQELVKQKKCDCLISPIPTECYDYCTKLKIAAGNLLLEAKRNELKIVSNFSDTTISNILQFRKDIKTPHDKLTNIQIIEKFKNTESGLDFNNIIELSEEEIEFYELESGSKLRKQKLKSIKSDSK